MKQPVNPRLAPGGCCKPKRACRQWTFFAAAVVLIVLAAFFTTLGSRPAHLHDALAAKAMVTLRSGGVARLHTRPCPPASRRQASMGRRAFDRFLQPVMTVDEALTLQWYASQAATYVEYGSGASTVWAAPLAGRALSIENHAPWCAEMRARADVSFWVAQGKLQYECIDIGETGEPKWRDGWVREDNGRGVCDGKVDNCGLHVPSQPSPCCSPFYSLACSPLGHPEEPIQQRALPGLCQRHRTLWRWQCRERAEHVVIPSPPRSLAAHHRCRPGRRPVPCGVCP